jgi:hypothetical protein
MNCVFHVRDTTGFIAVEVHVEPIYWIAKVGLRLDS